MRRPAAKRAGQAFALLAAVGAAFAIVVAQPVRGPWWVYAEADAVYTGNALNLVGGVQTNYLDHPGLPLQELLAVAFGVDFALQTIKGDVGSRGEYAHGRMLDLDQTRVFFRGLAILIYLGGTALVFLMFARLFGHWAWGLAGALAWLAAPGLIPASIQYKADMTLAVLVAVFAYLIGRALEERSASLYAAAAVLAGFAVMVKLHAIGLVPALALAAVWRPPAAGWWEDLRNRARRWARAKWTWARYVALAGLVPLTVAALVLNAGLMPWDVTASEWITLAYPVAILVGLYAASRLASRTLMPPALTRVLNPFTTFLAGAYFLGLALPGVLDFPDWVRALHVTKEAVLGRGVNVGVEPFGLEVFTLERGEMMRTFVVLALAAAGAVIGLRRRAPLPVVWFAGAAALIAMAFTRQAYIHYFAPGFVLAMPAAFWLISQMPRRAGVLLVWPLVLFLAVPVLWNRDWPTDDYENAVETATPSTNAVAERLAPGELALTTYYWPEPDNRWFNDVEFYVKSVPEYPYRFLPALTAAAPIAAERNLRFRYYVGLEVAELKEGVGSLELGNLGTFTLRRLEGVDYAAELLSGPGVTRPGFPPED